MQEKNVDMTNALSQNFIPELANYEVPCQNTLNIYKDYNTSFSNKAFRDVSLNKNKNSYIINILSV